MIWETHDFIGPPDSCFPPPGQSAVTQLNELASLWVNDSALADYLKQTYPGMPVYYSPIQTETALLGPVTQRTWRWGTDQGQSHLTVNDDGQRAGQNSVGRRLFWYTEAGVSFMDLIDDHTTQVLTGRGANGTLYPPMLWGYITNPYASTGEWETSSTLEGTITIFRDHLCKEPI
ncbi:MAG: hypothetical protein LC623_06375 [Halobacteriales archaeon]|nr:hypothetical protein [Halobacteriales archaeon]